MAKLTLQQVFSKAYQTFVLKEGRPALTSTVGCSYRTKDGRKCIIGLAIPDELYDPVIEGRNLAAVTTPSKEPEEGDKKLKEIVEQIFETNDLLALLSLQNIHDGHALTQDDGQWNDFPHFVDEMRVFAKKHNLEVPHV